MESECNHISHIRFGPREPTQEEILNKARRFAETFRKEMEKPKMSIRAKMTLENVYAYSYGGAKAIFRCTYDQKVAEDVSFQKATPSGMAEFQIDNPKAAEQLVIGKSYYFDISPAD